MVIHINPQDYIDVEIFLMENKIEYKTYHNLWQGYFEQITETAIERVLNNNKDTFISDEEQSNMIKDVAELLDEKEENFIYLLLKAEGLVKDKLKIKQEDKTMMNKRELTTLVCAITESVEMAMKSNNEVAERLQEAFDRISVIEDELVDRNLADEDKELKDDEDLEELRVGDYISIPIGDDKFELYKIINLEEHYLLLSEKDNSILSQTFYSLDEVVQFINIKEEEHGGSSTIYRVKDDFVWQTDERYLVYDKNYFEDFEILVSRDINDKMYEVITPCGNDYFLEERFTTIDELALHLHKEFGLIKQLRYSEYQ